MSKFLPALLMAAIFLSGCGGSNEPDILFSTPPSVNVEEEYLYDVDSAATPVLRATSDEGLIRVGKGICGALDRGGSFEEVVSGGLRSGYEIPDLQVLIAAAIVNFCPQHEDVLDSGNNA